MRDFTQTVGAGLPSQIGPCSRPEGQGERTFTDTMAGEKEDETIDQFAAAALCLM